MDGIAQLSGSAAAGPLQLLRVALDYALAAAFPGVAATAVSGMTVALVGADAAAAAQALDLAAAAA